MLNKLKNWIVGTPQPTNMTYAEINSFFRPTYSDVDLSGDALSEPTYYTCLKLLSESIGKLTLHLMDGNNQKVYSHDAVKFMCERPNAFMNPSTFKQLLEYNRNHFGNAYAYISYDRRGRLRGIYPLNPQNVNIYIDNDNLWDKSTGYFYEYTEKGQSVIFRPEEILHFKGGLSENGIVGRSVRETLQRTISTGGASEQVLQKLYNEGLTSNAVLKYTGDLDPAKRRRLVEELSKIGNARTSDRIIPIPMGFDLTPLNLKLTDSQFAELKKYNSLQIAAAFGIKPNQLNDYDKSSYSNSEMQNLSFYVETLLFILKSYEEELNAKLLSDKDRQNGLNWQFNIGVILRGDLKSQAEAITQYVKGSVWTVNEGREKAGKPPIDGGDVILVNGSYVNIQDLGMAYQKKGGEQDE